MDKRVIFAVAGSGKTTHIINNLSANKRSLIVTYTTGNYDNLQRKITEKFGGKWPRNITLMTYFSFLYTFCYKPFLSDRCKTRGVIFIPNPDQYARQDKRSYYMTNNRYLYSNRLALLIEKASAIGDVKARLQKYFDEFVIDEVQDIAGRDFAFLEQLMTTDMDMLFVGDFYQHTFDTSRDGQVNKTLFDNKIKYEKRFADKGFVVDNLTLLKSWRCSQNVCDYIRNNLGIEISSNRTDNTSIDHITSTDLIRTLLEDENTIKLHYQKGSSFGAGHGNWGASKGEDHHQDVCVMLNKSTATKRSTGKLCDLPSSTKNKLYVAITRAKGNVYLVNE